MSVRRILPDNIPSRLLTLGVAGRLFFALLISLLLGMAFFATSALSH